MSEQRLPSNYTSNYVPNLVSNYAPSALPSETVLRQGGAIQRLPSDTSLPQPQIAPVETTLSPSTALMPAAAGQPTLRDIVNTQGTDLLVNNIIKHEGGSPQGVMNNPGNIKFTGAPGQTDSGVKAVDGGTFASYESPESGRQAISDLIIRAANGQSPAYGQNPTLQSFLDTYTGKSARQGIGNSLQQQAFDVGKQQQEAYKTSLGEISKEMNQYKSIAARAPAGSDEMNSALARQMELSEKSAETFDKLASSPPQYAPKDIMERMGSLGTVIAVLGGLKSRQPLTAALGAAGEAMKALNQNNYDNYKIAYDQWKTHSELVVQSIRAHSEAINQILQNKRLGLEEKNSELRALATATENEFLKAKLMQGEIEAPYKLQVDLENMRMQWQKLQNDSDRLAQQFDAMQGRSSEVLLDPAKHDESGNPTPYLFNKITHQSTTMTGEPYQPGGAMKIGTPIQSSPGKEDIESSAKMIAEYNMAPISSWGMRYPFGQQVMKRVMELNPSYDAKKFTAESRALTNVTSGKAADTVRSFSVAIDHLGVARDIFNGLQNGDSRLLNKARNYMKNQLGYEGPPTFEFAKEIVGDEVNKAIIGGIGALTDRENLKSQLSVASSPAQFGSVINAAQRLMAGQLRGFKHQYSNVLTSEEFDSKLSDRAREVLEQGQQPSAPGGPPKEAVDLLLSKPDKRDQFDAMFGHGASDKILGPR